MKHHSEMWKRILKSKGTNFTREELKNMRTIDSTITRGFGLDRRFSPSYDIYRDEPIYQEILKIKESDLGNPEKIFFGHSGIFLRNACHAYDIIRLLKKDRSAKLTILDIGCGFGMLAFILKKYYSNAKLILVDLPETLEICKFYLADMGDIKFINSNDFKRTIARYDVAINIDSMSEMEKDVAINYLEIIETDIKEGGLFFFLNKEGLDKKAIKRPTLYPFSSNWKIEDIGHTYFGNLKDFRHIKICFRWSKYRVLLIRNKFLDLAYQLFSENNAQYIELFDLLKNDYRFSVAYHLIKIAKRFPKFAYESLSPIIYKKIKAGHYELFETSKLLTELGYHIKSEELLKEAVKIGHNDSSFYITIGDWFKSLGKQDTAEQCYKKAKEIGDRDYMLK